MKRINKKGFTLIELLAVIIILAILMTLAITAMSGYIRNAKKDTFITTAQQYTGAARLSFVNGEYGELGRGQCMAIKTNSIALESGTTKSSFDKEFDVDNSYVVIRNMTAADAGSGAQDKYEYYVQMVDAAGNGFGLMKEADIERANVIEKDVKTASVPDGSYQELANASTLKLFKGGAGTTGTTDGTCTLVTP